MYTHEHYEELCALAATGQIQEHDLPEFKDHLSGCLECRALFHDFADIGAGIVVNKSVKAKDHDVPAGMTGRFLARAHSQGIEINPAIVVRSSPRRRPAFSNGAIAAAAALVLAAFVALPRFLHQGKNTHTTARKSQILPLPLSPSPAPGQTELVALEQRRDDAARAQIARLTAQLKRSRDVLERTNRERAQLSAQFAALGQDNEQLEARDKDRTANLVNLQAQLDKLNAERVAEEVAVLAGENDVRELREALAHKDVKLQQLQHLVNVGNQVRDLIVARNFHVFDVYDNDGEGRQQKAFGRIFYTEGKSLVFYAYDLADPRKLDKQISFYAWGTTLAGNQPVKKLGIFHNEDVNDGRWVVSFDDPQVLAKIDSVFVTAEKTRKPVTHPNGKPFLNSYLGTQADHP